MRLAGYIGVTGSGANTDKQSFSMTAPVLTIYEPTDSGKDSSSEKQVFILITISLDTTNLRHANLLYSYFNFQGDAVYSTTRGLNIR